MKSYKEFISESKLDIHSICQKYGIDADYTINEDGSIDVDGNVWLNNFNLTKLPLKFGNVSGRFDCSDNQLTTLEGSPERVGENFDCSNNKLTSLYGGPQNVGAFSCGQNQLTSLEGSPQIIDAFVHCKNNQITDFRGVPEFFEGIFYCEENSIEEIYLLFLEEDQIFVDSRCIRWINEFDVIQGNKVIMDRLEEVFHQLGMEIPEEIELPSYEII
jgi:Leucine-rich repeat (LRR) protein